MSNQKTHSIHEIFAIKMPHCDQCILFYDNFAFLGECCKLKSVSWIVSVIKCSTTQTCAECKYNVNSDNWTVYMT